MFWVMARAYWTSRFASMMLDWVSVVGHVPLLISSQVYFSFLLA